MSDAPAQASWNDQHKQYAFEVWALLAGRDSRKTARILSQPPTGMEQSDRPPLNIPDRTIRYWAKTYNWDERIDREFRALFPGIHQRVAQEIAAGSVEAVDLLRKVVRGEYDPEDKNLKTQVDAAKTFLDRAGHMPWSRPSDNSRPVGPTRDYSESAVGLDEGQLLERLFDRVTKELPEGHSHE